MDPDGRRFSMSVPSFLCTALVAVGLVGPCAAAVAESDLATPPGGHPSGNFVLLGHCSKCHNSEDWAGGIAFDTISTTDIPTNAETWEKVVSKLRGRLMPPPNAPQP